MDKIKVMVVDDHPAFRDGLARLLQEERDFEVVAQAGTGEEAVNLALQLKPDVIVMDIGLPGISGTEAAKQIRSRRPETANLIFSAYDYQSYLIGALRAGAYGYLTKDTPLPELISAIRLVYSGKTVFKMKIAGSLVRHLATDKLGSLGALRELQPRELQVLSLVAQGMNAGEIGIRLNISRPTVKSDLARVFHKLGVNSRHGAVLQGLRLGWLQLSELQGHQALNKPGKKPGKSPGKISLS